MSDILRIYQASKALVRYVIDDICLIYNKIYNSEIYIYKKKL